MVWEGLGGMMARSLHKQSLDSGSSAGIRSDYVKTKNNIQLSAVRGDIAEVDGQVSRLW